MHKPGACTSVILITGIVLAGEALRVRGQLRLDYRWSRSTMDSSSDRDFRQTLELILGEEEDPVSFYFYGSLFEDVNGRRGRIYDSIYETYDHNVHGKLYGLYAEFHSRWGFEKIRVGRQYSYETRGLSFDGITLKSGQKGRYRFTVFGGKPVHYYESSRSGDWLFGGSLSYGPSRRTRLRLEYLYAKDNSEFLRNSSNHSIALSLWQEVTEWWDLYARVSFLDSPLNDFDIRSSWRLSFDVDLTARYYRQVRELEFHDYALELDPLSRTLSTLRKYETFEVSAFRAFGEDVSGEVGLRVRNSDDEDDFNEDSTGYFVNVYVDNFLREGLGMSVSCEHQHTPGTDDTKSISLELRNRLTETAEVYIGSAFYQYKYDYLGGRDENNVRTIFAGLKQELSERVSVRIGYEFESADTERFHTLRVGVAYRF